MFNEVIQYNTGHLKKHCDNKINSKIIHYFRNVRFLHGPTSYKFVLHMFLLHVKILQVILQHLAKEYFPRYYFMSVFSFLMCTYDVHTVWGCLSLSSSGGVNMTVE